jgi:hypothetical protein
MTTQSPPLTAPWDVKAPYLRLEPIGLARLPAGGHILRHPDGPLFIIIRRRRVVFAELRARDGGGWLRWTASPGASLPSQLAGYLALAESVVMPIA